MHALHNKHHIIMSAVIRLQMNKNKHTLIENIFAYA